MPLHPALAPDHPAAVALRAYLSSLGRPHRLRKASSLLAEPLECQLISASAASSADYEIEGQLYQMLAAHAFKEFTSLNRRKAVCVPLLVAASHPAPVQGC